MNYQCASVVDVVAAVVVVVVVFVAITTNITVATATTVTTIATVDVDIHVDVVCLFPCFLVSCFSPCVPVLIGDARDLTSVIDQGY